MAGDLVSLHTAAGLVVISPSRPDEFVARLGERLHAPAGPIAGRAIT
jgi:hypothetical protein